MGDAASQRKRDNPHLNHAGGFQDASKFSFYSSLECATDIARESGFNINITTGRSCPPAPLPLITR